MAFNTQIQTGTKSESTSTNYPRYVEDKQKAGYNALPTGMLSGMDGYSYKPQPHNSHQAWATGVSADNMHSALGNDFSGGILASGKGYDPSLVGGADIQALMNPYLEGVGRSTLASIGNSYDNSGAEMAARSASGVAFGGSGDMLGQAQLARSEAQDMGSTISGLLSGGYDRASQLALANAGMENQAGQFNAQHGLSANIAANSAFNDHMNRRGDAMQGLLTTGAMGQQQRQAEADAPWANLERYMGMLPGASTTQTTEKPQYFDPLSALFGLFS